MYEGQKQKTCDAKWFLPRHSAERAWSGTTPTLATPSAEINNSVGSNEVEEVPYGI